MSHIVHFYTLGMSSCPWHMSGTICPHETLRCPPSALKQLSMIPDRDAHCYEYKTFIFVIFCLVQHSCR